MAVINRALIHTHSHPAKKRSHPPTPSQKKVTPTHTQPKKGHTHPPTHAQPKKVIPTHIPSHPAKK